MNRIILFVAFMLASWSCETWLDKQPTGDMTLEEVFSERAYAARFLDNINRMGPFELNFADSGWEWRNPYVGGCDEMEIAFGGAYSHNINDGSWGPANIHETPIWRECYINIRRCNIFLNRVDGVPTTKEEKDRWKAEVYFQRAFNYFQIFRAYGPFVITDSEIPTDADWSTFKRSTVKACVDFMLDDLENAMILPPTVTDANWGRATSIAAKALKSRILLYQASPLWNGNSDYANFKNYDNEQLVPQVRNNNLWQLAADAALECITDALAAGYELYRSPNDDPYENYTGIWQEHNNKEWLFFKNCGSWQHANRCADPAGLGGFSILNPTQEMVDAYQMWDGATPIIGYTNDGLTPEINAASGYSETGFTPNEHPLGAHYHPVGVHNMYAKREPRFYASINFANQIWKADALQNKPRLEFWFTGRDGRQVNTSGDYCKTGYLIRKIIDHQFRTDVQASRENVRPQTWVFFRLGEIYLNYAEALNEAQGPVADVYYYVNEIRRRSGLPDLPPGLSQPQMQERIWHERRIELAFETHRFFDVRRWKIAEQSENKPIHSLNIMAGTNPVDEAFYERVVVEPRVFRAPRHYLFPLRTDEFDKVRKTVVQNPGWPGAYGFEDSEDVE